MAGPPDDVRLTDALQKFLIKHQRRRALMQRLIKAGLFSDQ